MQLHAYLTEDRPRLLKDASTQLILSSRGTAERGEGVHYLVETLRPLLPGQRLTPTVIRQSVIALKLKEGKGLRQVQVFAGHKWISTTEGYKENNLAELRLAVERFHPLATHYPYKSLLL
jgi:integrase/recombinase XerD